MLAWLLILALGYLTASLHYSLAQTVSLRPDLVWALAAWFAVQPPIMQALPRVWLIACLRDQIDPSSQWRHAGVAMGLGISLGYVLAQLPGLSALRWAMWAATASALELAVGDGLGGIWRRDALAQIGSTALLAVGVGFLLDRLHALLPLFTRREQEDWQQLLDASRAGTLGH